MTNSKVSAERFAEVVADLEAAAAEVFGSYEGDLEDNLNDWEAAFESNALAIAVDVDCYAEELVA